MRDGKTRKKRKLWQKILLILLGIVGAAVAAFAALILFLTITEYRPADRENLEIRKAGEAGAARETAGAGPEAGSSLSIMTWNIGYGCLGEQADFFMDGGSQVNTATRAQLDESLAAVLSVLEEKNPDILFIQEIDRDSNRSKHVNEVEYILDGLAADGGSLNASFANNMKVPFVPYPIPPIGKVDSGIVTATGLPMTEAERINLPCPFKWPVRVGNLKRGLLVSRIPVEGSDGKELVLVNLHLEAYDSGEGKIAQTALLKEVLETEAEKGNYVIAGGDFNQTFSNVDVSAYPMRDDVWQCGYIDTEEFGASWQFVMDPSVPSCRSLDQPYAGADRDTFQYYMIDGFIVSENIRVDSVETLDYEFKYSDHNPVELKVTLQ